MTAISLPFASDVARRRVPDAGELAQGIPCGPLDEKMFNWLFWYATGQLGSFISNSGGTPDDADLDQVSSYARLQSLNYRVASGTANALSVTLDPAPASNAVLEGMPIRLKITASNTSAATLNVGAGALPIKTLRGADVELGDLVVDSITTLICTGTAWIFTGIAYSEVPRIAPSGVVLWVRTDGSDNNDGLTNSASGAFATVMGAITKGLARYSLPPGQTALIRLGIPGTYAAPGSLPYVGAPLEIRGDAAAQASYVLSGAGAGSGVIAVGVGQLSLTGLTITNTGTISHSVNADNSGYVLLTNVTFLTSVTTTFALMAATGSGVIRMGAGCIVNASAGYLWLAGGGTIVMGANLALQSTPNYTTATAQALDGGKILRGSPATAFTGTGALGLRYNAQMNGIIDMLFGGASFIPGNSAGTTATGGQYQ
ncbi:hypothetical protein ABLE91_05865 [Aquabacter sp. CN5-332]|uniref:hypothetical protein n=1 Tax=Aquabacter sp. CN5-332 TaxID=3156608 RepID=UPI0032B336D8